MLNLGNVQRLSNGEKVKVIRMIWFNEVNEEKLKLEQTLVEYDREPMLFICKGVREPRLFTMQESPGISARPQLPVPVQR